VLTADGFRTGKRCPHLLGMNDYSGMYSGGCIYVKEKIETKRDNKTKQDKGVKARDEGNLIQHATDIWQ
jgi:hypothetical protein